MAAQSNAHPVYTGNVLSRQERWQLGRKFGKYDFDQFRPLQTSDHFLGKGKIGDMNVACKFLFRKSRWGVLAPDRNPGGILYVDLVFTEPPDCYLRGASIILTLDEHDTDLQHHFSIKNNTRDRLPVHITEHGPQHLLGQSKRVEKFRTRQFIPSVSAAGFEVGGMGQESKTRKVQESQWRFSSAQLPDRSGRAVGLRWDLCESDLDRQPKHKNTFHTALAFEHDGQPFFIRVEVNGTLESTALNLIHKTKTKLKKLKFSGESQTATTLVYFGGRDNCYTQPLDELARRIPSEMVHANMKPADQVQTLQTSKTEAQGSDVPDDMTLVNEWASSDEVPISQAPTEVPDEDEMAELKENILALMALHKANPERRAFHNAYTPNENLPKAPSTMSRLSSEMGESFDESSRAALGSRNESEQPTIAQSSPSTGSLQHIRDLLRELGVLPALVQETSAYRRSNPHKLESQLRDGAQAAQMLETFGPNAGDRMPIEAAAQKIAGTATDYAKNVGFFIGESEDSRTMTARMKDVKKRNDEGDGWEWVNPTDTAEIHMRASPL
ncbi:hypothetical protein NUW58_g4035 [Xylaria curta]|uniref:Uncharacterized protein n=1 Tax=Xylaria curta TaxID=42375 RepID=A0ACC1P9E6_9PEZI|nr:hypothetical protein NUW58_g4035 [Xylaria curta]